MGIMDNGRMIALGTHAELVQLVGGGTRLDVRLDREAQELNTQWRELAGVGSVVKPEEARFEMLAKDAPTLMPKLFESAQAAGVRITEISLAEPNLEMVFLHLTGRALRD